jgi:hypothetical protein
MTSAKDTAAARVRAARRKSVIMIILLQNFGEAR